MAAAPAGRTGEAGGLLNLLRALGCMIGIATASTALSWRLHALSGLSGKTLEIPPAIVLRAAAEVLWVLLLFAIAAGCAALFRVPIADA
jgi:hypothetical protein